MSPSEYSVDQLIRYLDAHPDAPFAQSHREIVAAYLGSQRQMDRFPDDDRAKDPLGYELARGYNLGISRAVSELAAGVLGRGFGKGEQG